jgi:hypothetical protein
MHLACAGMIGETPVLLVTDVVSHVTRDPGWSACEREERDPTQLSPVESCATRGQ